MKICPQRENAGMVLMRMPIYLIALPVKVRELGYHAVRPGRAEPLPQVHLSGPAEVEGQAPGEAAWKFLPFRCWTPSSLYKLRWVADEGFFHSLSLFPYLCF